MKPRALVISPTSNVEKFDYRDAEVVALGLKRAGYAVHFANLRDLIAGSASLDFASFDIIDYPAPFNALWRSSTANYDFFTRLHTEAKEGALTLHFCDITFPLDPHIWDPKVGRSETRINLMKERPVRIIGSFADAILHDEAAMALIHSKLLSKVHPDSRFVPVEWNTFNFAMEEQRGGLGGPAPESRRKHGGIDRFYYGIEKPKLVPSLKRLGLGESSEDAVFGRIGKRFPEVRNLAPNRASEGESYWLPHALSAKRVLLPFEPVKGEYQVTLRFLEALRFYPDTAVTDPLVPDWMRSMVTEQSIWRERMAKAEDLLAHLHETEGYVARSTAANTTTDKVSLNPSLNQGVTNVAGAIYRVVDLNAEPTVEGEPVEAKLLTDVELLERFAPGIDSTKASQAKLANDWLKSFAASEAIQVGFGVKVEKVDAGQVFDQRLENFRSLEEQARAAKKSLVSALRAVLADITKEEIDEGEIHSVSTGSKLKVGIVEVFVTKSKEPAKSLIAKYGNEFSPEVLAELDKLSKKRSEEAARRTGRA